MSCKPEKATAPRPRVLDGFAGPGGWDEGIKHLDLEVVGLEWDTAACNTARAAGHVRHQVDVSAGDPAEYGPVRGLIMSPPCQGFSPAGKRVGAREDAEMLLETIRGIRTYSDCVKAIEYLREHMKDSRSIFVLEPLRYALRLTPTWIALEQVVTVLPIWEAIAEVLGRVGYSVKTGFVQAEQYGVPQTRKRAYLVAVAPWVGAEAEFPAPTHSKYYPRDPGRLDEGVLPFVTTAEALAGTFHARHAEGAAEASDVVLVAGNQENAARRSVDYPAPTVAFGHNVTNHRFVPVMANEGDPIENGDWVYKRPSVTIVGSYKPEVLAGPGYRKAGDGPRQKAPGSVQITKAQAAVLQSFPEYYPWKGSNADQWRQIGDAVPPKVAGAVVGHLEKLCKRP